MQHSGLALDMISLAHNEARQSQGPGNAVGGAGAPATRGFPPIETARLARSQPCRNNPIHT